MHVRMYLCTYVFMYVCMNDVCIYVHSMNACIMYVCMYVCMYV